MNFFRMKRFYLTLSAVFAFLCLSAQVVVRTADHTLYILPISAIDSITFEAELQCVGRFCVAPDRYVGFARGNLQCAGVQSGRYRWAFASEQYAYLGAANLAVDASGNAMLSDTIDLFGWSSNNPATPWGISLSVDEDDYTGTFVDWGTNIDDGTTWRTLTKEEWYYLFVTRADAARLFALGSVNGVNGVILLPDAWAGLPGVSFTPSVSKGMLWYADYGMYADFGTSGSTHYTDNSYSKEDWSLLERAGAVFLPCAGARDTEFVGGNAAAQYWTTETDEEYPIYAYCLLVWVGSLTPNASYETYYGHAVRLVTELP